MPLKQYFKAVLIIHSHHRCSKVFLRSRSDPASKHRTRDRLVEIVKRIHDRLQPRIVHINEEVLDSLLGRRGSGIIGASVLGTAGGGTEGGTDIGRGMRVRVRQEHELDISAGDIAGDVVVVVSIDVLEVPFEMHFSSMEVTTMT